MTEMKKIRALEPGASIVYHIGNLSRDRLDPKIGKQADLYKMAARRGQGALTQRRVREPYVTTRGDFVDGAFAYIFTRFGKAR